MIKFLSAIIFLFLIGSNIAQASTSLVDVGINLYGILMFIGGAAVLSSQLGPVAGIILSIIITAIIFMNN